MVGSLGGGARRRRRWLNGGPGCSSLGGMLTELGPFVVGAEGNVTLNPWSWNSVANVLFLEQPAGVGFSYPVLPANDSTTAEETVEALVGFLRMHTELRGRKVYVMGESYGGHYVPNTAAAILSSNARLASPDAADHIEILSPSPPSPLPAPAPAHFFKQSLRNHRTQGLR